MSETKEKKMEFTCKEDSEQAADLWERISEDIERTGSPCLETIEKLVDESCHAEADSPDAPNPKLNE